MADMFRRASPGAPIAGLPAETWNLMLDCLRDYQQRRTVHSAADFKVKLDTDLKILNATGSALNQYSIVALGSQLVGPAEQDSTFFGDIVFNSAAPTTSGPFAIIQAPAASNDIVEALGSGLSLVRVQFGALTDGYAAPAAGVYTHLVSQAAAGPARIEWQSASGSTTLHGTISAGATSITVTAGTSFPSAPSFTAQIGTEQMLVTGVTGNVWTVTRGYGGTTAASHTDGAAISLVAGECWALVVFDPSNSSGGGGSGLTSLNALTGPALTLDLGTAGTDASWQDHTSIIDAVSLNHLRLELPDASPTARGLITTSVQTLNGSKTFNNVVTGNAGFVTINGQATSDISHCFLTKVKDLSNNDVCIAAFGGTDSARTAANIVLNSFDEGSIGKAAYLTLYPPSLVATTGGTPFDHTILLLRGECNGFPLIGGQGGGQDHNPAYALDCGLGTIAVGRYTASSDPTNCDRFGYAFCGGLFTNDSSVGVKLTTGPGVLVQAALGSLVSVISSLSIALGGTGATTAVGGIDHLHTKSTDIAGAATTDLSAAGGDYVEIT